MAVISLLKMSVLYFDVTGTNALNVSPAPLAYVPDKESRLWKLAGIVQ